MKLCSLFTLLLIIVVACLLFDADRVVADWPTYMHDNERTGITTEKLTLPLGLQWIHESRHPPRPAWPPSAKRDHWGQKQLSQRVIFDRAHHVVAGDGRIIFGTSADDKVICLDQQSGRELWRFFSEGPVRLAPSLDSGRVYFGSDDGCVYCLKADTGDLVWKNRVAPESRRIPGNERLISAWPVRSGVVIFDQQIRCTAGIFPRQGAYQFTLDAKTGEKLAQAPMDISPQGYLQRRGDNIYFDSGRSGMIFWARTDRRVVWPVQSLKEDDKTSPRPSSIIGTAHLRFLGSNGKVTALDARSKQEQWSASVDGQVHSLAVSDGALLVSTDRGKIYCFTSGSPVDVPPVIRATTKVPRDSEGAVRSNFSSAAERILAETEVNQGYCLVLGSDTGRLAYELAVRSDLQIIGIESDQRMVSQSRRMLDRAGVYGTRVTINHVPLDKLPYADYLFNLIVSERSLTDGQLPGTAAEVHRVLRPEGGTAYFASSAKTRGEMKKQFSSWRKETHDWRFESNEHGQKAMYRREPLAGTGQWTHLNADPANSVCSGDDHVGDRLRLQWFGPPGPRKMVDRHFRAMSPLYKNGRLFVPGDNHLFAVDAYNGSPLWERSVPGFRRLGIGRDAGSMALTDDLLYVLTEQQCLALKVADGKQLAAFPVANATDGKARRWGYLAAVGKNLFGSATKPRASRHELTRKTIHEAYQDYFPLVTSDYLFSLQRRTGAPRWRYEDNTGAIINPSIAIGHGHIFFVESGNPATLRAAGGRNTLKSLTHRGATLVALNLDTGKPVWKQPIDLKMLGHDVFLSVAGDRLILAGSGNVGEGEEARLTRYLFTYAAANGTPGWSHVQSTDFAVNAFHGEQNVRPVIVGDRVYLQPDAFELDSGRPVPGWKMIAKRKGCGLLTASNSAFFFRHQHCNVLDLASMRQSEVTHVTRPGCWINILPVGGLLLIPEASSGCSCAHSVQCSLAFVPADKGDKESNSHTTE